MLCKNYIDKPPARLIKNRVILKTKRKLSSPHVSIKVIVYDLGFKNMPQFYQVFKTETCYSLSEFRRLLQLQEQNDQENY